MVITEKQIEFIYIYANESFEIWWGMKKYFDNWKGSKWTILPQESFKVLYEKNHGVYN